jgi:hypothetical protein
MANSSFKVLVLGAGASLAYGFPTGGELRQLILNFSEDSADNAGIITNAHGLIDPRAFEEFKTAFRKSQITSIDAFLGRRPQFSEIGKKCIAAILLRCERANALFSEAPEKDHWYQYLFNHFAKRDWEELTFDDIAIISFNYDRSLEHFLHVALQNAYGKNAQEASLKLKSLRIVHVYGSLSDELPDSPSYLGYDGKIDADKVNMAAKGLNVIPEGRSDSPALVKARGWLADANAIGFLGFGFDSTNVERLAEDGVCQVAITRMHGSIVRHICGSRIGMYDAEMKRAFMALIREPIFASEVDNFMDLNCTKTLRSTLFLDR